VGGHQKAIPLKLITDMVKRPATDPALITFHQLFLLAFFFALRSCEYLKVAGPPRRTLPLTKASFVFIKNHRILPHSSPDLHLADSVSAYFDRQKRETRGDQVTQSRTGHPLLCPVVVAATVVRRLEAMGASDDTQVYTYVNEQGRRKILTGAYALSVLRDYMKKIDPSYNLPAKDIGLHSVRASAAMAMYLNDIPVYTIMLIGRWSSDAFLRYIRPQVADFSRGVAKAMIKNSDYYHVPDSAPRDDPRAHNPNATTATQGMGSSRRTNLTAFKVWS